MTDFDKTKPWYHGSQQKLTILRTGSSITQNQALALAFSHRPSLVSITEEGKVKHNGTTSGFLYRVCEEIRAGDIYPHPHPGNWERNEWLTKRDVRVEPVDLTEINEAERLTDDEIKEMKKKQESFGLTASDGPKIAYPIPEDDL